MYMKISLALVLFLVGAFVRGACVGLFLSPFPLL